MRGVRAGDYEELIQAVVWKEERIVPVISMALLKTPDPSEEVSAFCPVSSRVTC